MATGRAERPAGRAETAEPVRVPRSTYRLQITPSFTLADAAAWVPYLHGLGADWVYLSPLLQSAAGSDHGYDVVDHSRTDAARGGRAGLAGLADAAHAAGMGVLVDIVPNHVGIASAPESLWWWDVLRLGRGSPHAAAFDIDWAAGDDKVLLPVLGDEPDALDRLRVDGDVLRYFEHTFPLAPHSAGAADTPREVHDAQHYRLVNFRLADTDLNYRRFFAVSSLAAIRVEDPAVFAGAHAEIRRWFEAGWVDGLRVDHPDGLADPRRYLADLAALTGGRYTVVEKILEPGEEVPIGWRCSGTTGYDTLALIDRLLIDPAGRDTLEALDTELRGGAADWARMVHDAKRAVADGILGSEVRRVARVLQRGSARAERSDDPGEGDDARLIDAIAELAACFPVYRSYLPSAAEYLDRALADARRRRPDLDTTLAEVSSAARPGGSEAATRLEQTSGAVMAKGVEDRAFYRYPRLTSLTEVGGDPSIFAVDVAAFHRAQQHRLSTWPDGMTTLSTHDTKRGEDVRARIDVLAEIPGEWARTVRHWLHATDFPDRVLGQLILQTAVGAWPVEPDRLHGYALKAAREAGVGTGWIDPDDAFEAKLHALVDACYDATSIGAEIDALAARLRPFGWSNSLAAKAIQITAPGVPDVYRGTELWQNSLVDPDNRRLFDAFTPDGAAESLGRLDAGWLPPIDATGAAKLLITSRALRARRDRPDLFTDYRPVDAQGPAADHVVAFDRGGAVTVATRLPFGLAARGGWRDTSVALPAGAWHDAFTGAVFEGRPAVSGAEARLPGRGADGRAVILDASELLARYPVALLLPADRPR